MNGNTDATFSPVTLISDVTTFRDVTPKLVKKLLSVGRGTDVLLFSSHSNDKRKNPLNHRDKVKYLKKFFGKIVVDANVRTVFEICNYLQQKKYTKVNMVVGSDRVKEFEALLTKYNGVKARHGYYKFKEININSCSVRCISHS